MLRQLSEAEARGPREQAKWSPYVNNGGTVVAIAGEDFCVVAGDTRLSTGYSISTRHGRKVLKLTEKAVIATSGMQADQGALHKVLQARLQTYEYEHRKPMSTPAIAQLLSTTLYHKRFFPYYTFNVLGGLDEEGRGVVYSYDAVGSFERVNYSSSGTGQQLLQPLLDNQIGWKDQVATKLKPRLTQEETVDLLKDIFTSAGERDIYTGDSVDIIVIDASGVKEESFALKKD
ncbi:Pbf1p [Balamuthia mandrillaris]